MDNKHILKPGMRAAALAAAAMIMAAGFPVNAADEKKEQKDGGLKIVTMIFPEYDWVMNILGDNPGGAEVTMFLDKGIDIHSYQPSVDDILTINSCDMLIYGGGESGQWVKDTLEESSGSDAYVINLIETLGSDAREEETVEGMQEESDPHEEEADAEKGEDAEDEVEYDEHVWLSLRNAGILVKAVSETLQKLDPDNAEAYKTNTEAYLEKLDSLDSEYEAVVADSSVKTLLFGDRFPFRYLTDDYGIDYYAAFAGCSAETEASFDTIIFLAQKADELELPAVITIDGSDKRIAETIVQNTKSKDQKILTLDSMQSTDTEDIKNGITYLSVMENNLKVLEEALNP